MNPLEHWLISISGLIILSTIASKAGSRFGVPSLLLFILIGILSGSHGPGRIVFTNYQLAQNLGAIALVFILFSGGMDTQLSSARKVIQPALILSTFGVVVATALIAVFAHRLMGVSMVEGGLLGAAVSATDVAAVFTLLRSRNVSLIGHIGPLLELESALNDPMAVFLSVGLLGLLTHPSAGILALVPAFFLQMILGLVLGWVFGKAAVLLVNRIRLEFEGLYPVFSVGWVLLTFALTQSLGGSGFLAVYVAGIFLGNANLLHKRSLVHFHEGVAWLMQIAMFLTMGLLINPHEILEVAPMGLALSAFLVFVARPASVFVCFPGRSFSTRVKLMISWAGLRGAVPIILSMYILTAQIPRSGLFFNLVFFVTFCSLLLQGTTVPLLAKWLDVSAPFKMKFRFPIEFNPSQNLRNSLIEVMVSPTSIAAGKSLLEIELPKDVLVTLIERQGAILVPRGGTQLEPGDSLLVLGGGRTAEEVRVLLG